MTFDLQKMSNNEIPTPRTDKAETESHPHNNQGYVYSGFARTLERELTQAIKEQDEARLRWDNMLSGLGTEKANLVTALDSLRSELTTTQAENTVLREALERAHKAWVFYVNSPNAPIAATVSMDAAIQQCVAALSSTSASTITARLAELEKVEEIDLARLLTAKEEAEALRNQAVRERIEAQE